MYAIWQDITVRGLRLGITRGIVDGCGRAKQFTGFLPFGTKVIGFPTIDRRFAGHYADAGRRSSPPELVRFLPHLSLGLELLHSA